MSAVCRISLAISGIPSETTAQQSNRHAEKSAQTASVKLSQMLCVSLSREFIQAMA